MTGVTIGAIARIQGGETNFKPVLMISGIKNISPTQDTSKPSRYRLSMKDDKSVIQGMLATQLNELAENGSLVEGSIVQLSDFITQTLNGQQILVLLSIQIVGYDKPVDEASPAVKHTVPPIPPVSTPSTASYGGSYGSYGGTYGGSTNSRPVQRLNDGGDHSNIMPISALNPYSNRWTIKARITNKSDIRVWNNAKGSGKLFSIDLLDANNGEIRATLFKEAADKWFPILEQGQVYTISGGRLKVADRKFSKLNNDYELTLDASSDIRPSFDDSIKQVNYNFTKIADLTNVEVNSSVDILAMVRSADECRSIISQKLGGKELFKRELLIYDDSNMEVRLTLWGEKAQEEFDWNNEVPVVALKGVGVGDYNGRTLSMRTSSNMAINPDLPEAKDLFEWRQRGGGQSGMGSLSSAGSSGGVDREVPLHERTPLSLVKENALGMGEKPDYITFKGVITHIFREREPWYTACPTQDCNKKVVEAFNGQWSCEKCNREFPNCQRRYMLYASVSDHTGDSGFTLFNDTAEQLLGYTADDLHDMKQSGNEADYDKVFQDAMFKQVIVKARVKQELRDDEMKTKSSVMNLKVPIDYGSECSKLLEAIDMYQ